MNPLEARFAELKERGEKALVAFVTAGDPALDQLVPILSALEEGGADVIEIGIPFSDPIADGPVIQAASQRALDRGVTTEAVLREVAKFNGRTPLIAMGYMNPMMRIGLDGFAERAKEAGFSGVIVCDLIPEEGEEWGQAARAHGLSTIYLVAPTSTDARLDLVSREASGFVYSVSRTGVTGAGSTMADSATSMVARVKSRTDLPVCVGFGISTPEHVRQVCAEADGAVVGSMIVNWLAERWHEGINRPAFTREIVALKAATKA
jgi:tryptophan synthase alpha chain